MSGFIDFWNRLIFSPREFFESDFRAERSPYFFLVLLVYGISVSIDNLDRTIYRAFVERHFEFLNLINRWPVYWTWVGILGLVGGYLFYRLGGWFYNLRVRWSGGRPNIQASRFIFLYSYFVPGFLAVLFAVQHSLTHSAPFDPYEEPTAGMVLGWMLIIIALFYSLYISYRGVRTVMAPDPWRARVWFVILPGALYLVGLVGIFIMLASF